MSSRNHLDEALKIVREAGLERHAPEGVELRLRAAFREQHSMPPQRSLFGRWVWAAGAFAAVAAIFVLTWQPQKTLAPTEPTKTAVHPSPVVVLPPAQQPVQPHVSSSPRVAVRSKPPRPVKRPVEVEFLALPFAPPLNPEDQGQVIRVRIPRNAIRNLGLPVNEDLVFDRVPADILMGQDGVARGIRLVATAP